MSIATIIVIAGWSTVCCVWLGLLVAQRRARRDGLLLDITSARRHAAVPEGDMPSVCVVIAARNEGAGLRACLQNVLAQDHSELSVVLVDDRSEDDTLAIARRCAQCNPRLRVEHVDSLPARWMGKSHALWQGARQAKAEWLLFMDADCRLEPRAITRAVEEARRRRAQLLTLWPRQAAGGFWEHATIPLCGGIIALWFGSQRVNDPSARLAFANGQFILIERAAYERIGGHESVRAAIIEDIPLAEHAKRSGLVCWVASGRDIVSVRMYERYAAIVAGWARIYVGALRSGVKIALSIVWLLAGSLLPYLAAVALVMDAWTQVAEGNAISTSLQCFAALCATHLVLMLTVSYRFWSMGGCRRIDLLWYPLSVCVVVRILAQSWWWLVVSREVSWRDTSYAIDRRGRVLERR
jgi:cellulose synthase/poly-beta-1,6-N-acetylglucosamine synthase-like glycosyltransferase